MELRDKILKFNTRNGVMPELSPWFESLLEEQIRINIYEDNREQLKDGLVRKLIDYRDNYKIDNIILTEGPT